MKVHYFTGRVNAVRGIILLMFLTFTFGMSIVEAQEVPEFGKIRPGTLKNGALSNPYDMVGSWSESFLDFHFIPAQAGLLGTGDNISGGPDNYMNFRMMFPVGYDSLDEDTSYPIILFLHGAGESGRGWNSAYSTTDQRYDNNSHQLVHGGRRHRDAVLRDPSHPESFNGFLLFPQSHRSGAWAGNFIDEKENAKAALGILQILIRNLKIDPSRIYVTGLSAGGQGTWESILRKPELFAAAAPVSGTGSVSVHVPIINHIPIWISQGGTDRNPSPGASTTMLEALAGQGVPYYDPLDATRTLDLPSPYLNSNLNRYSLYPNLGHGVWNNTYNRRDYFQWLLSKKKNSLRILGNSLEICLGEGVKLGVSSGFEDYQWSRNGVPFPAGNGFNEINATDPGVYRVRFKNVPNFLNSEWSEWSDPVEVTIKDAPDVPRIFANSTSVAISGLVNLEGPSGFSNGQYQWYFNGTSLGTSAQNRTLNSVSQSGIYSLAVRGASGCFSPLGNFILYRPASVDVLNVPTEISATATVNTITLNWQDNSPNETGFEIHRRTGTDENSWRLVHVTSENETSFTDYGLVPNTPYAYRVHAINPTGNSGPSSIFLISTIADIEAPSPVGNLWGTIDFSQKVTLTWDEATDNVGVVGYRVYEPNSTTAVRATVSGLSYVMDGLANETTYTFSVSAIDAAGNVSLPTSVELQTFSIGNGVTYKYYHGDWSLIPGFSLLTPLLTGIHTNFDLNAPRLQDDFFGYWFDGFIEITNAGNYTFWTRSDDGSKLFITPTGGTRTEVVNNDGLHGNQNRNGVINLAPGMHRIEVHYFERTGGQNLEVRYAFGNNISFANSAMIPNNRLYTYRDNQPPTTISNLQAISTDASITLSWDAARDNFGMKGYNIYNSSNQKIGFTDALNFNIGDLQPETAYTFSVAALDLFDNESAKVSISTNTLPVQQPNAPTNLTAIAQSFDRILLRWHDNSDNENGFEIERRLTSDPDENFVLVATAPKNAVEFVNTGLISNTSYTYRVRAVNSLYQSDYSNNRIIRTQPDLPLAPSALQVVINPDSASFTISWTDNSTSEDGFQLWKSLNADEGYNLLATIGPDTVTFIDQEVSVGTRFYYRVRAFNKDGNSAFAGPVGAHIPGPLNVSPVNWKLIPTAANVPNHSDIVADWFNGEDYMDEIRLDPGDAAKKQFNFRLPTNMPDDGMFIYSFRNPFSQDGANFGGISVKVFSSNNSSNGINGDWIALPDPKVRPRNDDLQKIDILRSYSGQWLRVEISNVSAQHIFLKEFGLYQFIPGQRHNYVIVLGASLMESMGSHRDFHNNIQMTFPGFGLQPVVFNWSISGTTAGALTDISSNPNNRLQNIDSVLSQHPRAGYVMIHTGGNNVSSSRPATFEASETTINTNIVNPIIEAINKIKQANVVPVLAPLTFRDYKTDDYRVQGQPVNQGFNQERGSLPYNLSLFEVIKNHVPDFYNETERRPWVDVYGALLNNQGIIGPDGVHFSNPSAYRQMWIDMAFKYIYTGERNKPVIWQTLDGQLDSIVEVKVAQAEGSMLLSDIWHARIFAQQVSDRFNRLAFLDRLDSLERPILYYLRQEGANPSILSNWSHTIDGFGVSPQTFEFDRQVFVVNKNTSLHEEWNVNGFRNRVRVAKGVHFLVDNSSKLNSTIDIDSLGIFEYSGVNFSNLSSIPFKIGNLEMTSKVIYKFSNSAFIPPGIYGDLELSTIDNSSWQKLTFAPQVLNLINGDLIVSRGRLNGNSATDASGVSKVYLKGNIFVRNNASFLSENNNERLFFELIGDSVQNFFYHSSNTDRTFRFFTLNVHPNRKLSIQGSNVNLEIGRTGSTIASSLILNGGSSIDLGSNNLLINGLASINTNNQTGKILSNGGNITFNSTSAQNSNLYFDSLQNRLNSLNLGTNQTGSGTIHIRSGVDISQKLDVKAGNLNSNGHIRLLSNASSTAFIDRVGASANISGEFTVQRFLPQQPRRWRYMAFPVQGFSVEDLQATMPVTGNFEGTTTGYNRNPTIYEWDDVWAPFPAPGTSNQEIFDLGKGYSVHTYIANRPMTVEAKGTIATKTFNFDLKYSAQSPGNWNLLGNPFAAPISWTSLNGWVYDTAKVAGSIYINAYSGTGISTQTFAINKSGVGDSSHILISPGQAFWVQTRATSPTLQVNENAKVLNNSSLIFRTDGTEEEQDIASSEDENALPVLKNILRFTVVQGGFRDNAYLHFRDDATFGFDPQFDAHKRLGSIAAIGSMSSDSLSLAINSMPRMLCERTIGLTLRNVVNATYQLELSRTHEFDYMVDFALIDHFTGDTVSFSQFTNYSFTCSNDAGSKRVDRFSLLVSPKPIQEISSAIVAPFCEGESSGISLESVSKGFYYFAMHDGVAVTDTLIASGNNLYLPFIDSLPVGQLQLELYRGIDYCGFDVVYSIAVLHSPLVAISDLSPVKVCKDENFHIDFPDLPEGATVNIYNQVNDMMPMVSSMEKTVFMNALSGSRNYYYSISNAFGCEHPDRKLLPIEVKAYPTPSITHRGAFLTSSSDNNNQWYWNNVPIPNANSQTIFIQGMGQFQVEVQYEECTKVSEPLMIGRSFQANAYPNPAKDYIIFTLDNPDGEEFDIEIHNMRGVVVQRMDKSTDDFYIVDLKGMSNGVYVFRARSATKNVAIRFVKI